uniref:F-box associated domain-containing protein n=1 Tax=Aegilops tauschii TaxID=37682 RepID=M8BXY7_AEGTA
MASSYSRTTWLTLPLDNGNPCHRVRQCDVDADFTYEDYLVFDPTLSPHYEVFVIPRLRYKRVMRGFHDNNSEVMEKSEWPSSVLDLHVFSSKSGCWEGRGFIREGKAVGTVAEMRRPHWSWDKKRYGVYWRGDLFVLCEAEFTMRISLSNCTYRLIKSPMDTEVCRNSGFHLGRLKKGVYLASLHTACLLMVWVLEVAHGHTNWVLKHNICLKSILQRRDYKEPVLGSWVLQDINFDEGVKYYKEHNEHAGYMEFLMQKKSILNSSCKEELLEEEYEWDSENDDILDQKDVVGNCYHGCVGILGFHPYKEIVFLKVSLYRALAYHLKVSKVQDLGYIYPTSYYEVMSIDRFIRESFLYTPCWIRHESSNGCGKPLLKPN